MQSYDYDTFLAKLVLYIVRILSRQLSFINLKVNCYWCLFAQGLPFLFNTLRLLNSSEVLVHLDHFRRG